MQDLSTKSVLVVDSGLFQHVAHRLAKEFGEVYLFTEWRAPFPTSDRALIGSGFDNVHQVKSMWDVIDAVDLVVFTDVYQGDLQEWLRTRGYRVWGSGRAENLELKRVYLKRAMKECGLEVPDWKIIRGVPDLTDYLEKNRDVYVKCSTHRGDFETFHSVDLTTTKPWLDDLTARIGPKQDWYEFVVEHSIDGSEVGYDGFTVDGSFPSCAAYGPEVKDCGYVGKVYRDGALPEALKTVNDALAPLLRAMQARSFMSTEVRVRSRGKGPILMDPAMRAGSPPSEVYMDCFSNWGEVIWNGAAGTLTDLESDHDYLAQIILKSDWCEEHTLAVDIPDEHRDHIKLHNHYRHDGADYVSTLGFPEFGSAIGLGSSLEEAVEMATEAADAVKGYQVRYDKNALDSAMEAVEDARKVGIDW